MQETLDEAEAVHGGDSALSATGERQLRFHLRTKPADFQVVAPHVVYCSPLQRALRTALAAYPERRIVVDPRLREIDTRAGMQAEQLRSFVATAAPQRKAKIDTAKVPEAVWWGDEDQDAATKRVQRFLKEICKTTSKGKVVALVSHSLLFKTMIGELKPFPKTWGSARGFPRNMKLYYGTVDDTAPEKLKVAPSAADSATLLLLRHAHSRAQAGLTLRKKIDKFKASPNKTADAASALDRQIKKFSTPTCG